MLGIHFYIIQSQRPHSASLTRRMNPALVPNEVLDVCRSSASSVGRSNRKHRSFASHSYPSLTKGWKEGSIGCWSSLFPFSYTRGVMGKTQSDVPSELGYNQLAESELDMLCIVCTSVCRASPRLPRWMSWCGVRV
jgi:hypothetical protein